MSIAKRISSHILYWILSAIFLSLFLGHQSDDFALTFLFAGILLPIAGATSYTFIYFLFPRYLFQKKYFEFFLYAFFFIVLSIYLEMLVVTGSFIFIANYNYDNMIPGSTNLINLAVGMYFIVFLSALIHLVKRWSKTTDPKQEERPHLLVRENREMVRIDTEDILYIESLDNYVKIHLSDRVVITKERISKLAKELPPHFIRIHRSYVINKHRIESFTKESVSLRDEKLPISRTYKPQVMESLGTA